MRCLRKEKSPALPLAGRQVYLDAAPRLTEQNLPGSLFAYGPAYIPSRVWDWQQN